MCDVGISKCVPLTGSTKCAVSAVLMFSGIACPSFLKMVSDKEYPRVHANRQHALAFIGLVEFFSFRNPGYLLVVLFMVTSLTMGVFLLEP